MGVRRRSTGSPAGRAVTGGSSDPSPSHSLRRAARVAVTDAQRWSPARALRRDGRVPWQTRLRAGHREAASAEPRAADETAHRVPSTVDTCSGRGRPPAGTGPVRPRSASVGHASWGGRRGDPLGGRLVRSGPGTGARFGCRTLGERGHRRVAAARLWRGGGIRTGSRAQARVGFGRRGGVGSERNAGLQSRGAQQNPGSLRRPGESSAIRLRTVTGAAWRRRGRLDGPTGLTDRDRRARWWSGERFGVRTAGPDTMWRRAPFAMGWAAKRCVQD